jgi:predicted nucleic acid-binding protein
VKLFIDTSALIALADRTDQYHAQASRFLQTASAAPECHTSNYVLNEVITRLRFTAGVPIAVKFAESIRASRLYQIHQIDQRIEGLALAALKQYAGHPLSFTDCTTIVLMDQLRLTRIFAFDEDFRKAGYLLVP